MITITTTTMRPAIRRGIALALCLLAAPGTAYAEGVPTADASQPATLPANPPVNASASQPAGKWSCWSASPTLGPRAASPKALWFGECETGHIWRYDLQTQKTQVFSALDGLPLEQGSLLRITVASDERCAILIEGQREAIHRKKRAFLWHPKEGWRALPPANVEEADIGMTDIGFDAQDRLLGVYMGAHSAIVELAGDKWRPLCEAPVGWWCFIPLPEGYGLGAPGQNMYTFIPANDSAHPWVFFNVSHGCPSNPQYFRAGGRTIAFFAPGVAFDITPKGLHEFPKAPYSGWDMKAKGILSCRLLEKTGEHVLVRPEVPGAPDIELPNESADSFEPLRDADGGLWWGSKRWDGKQWQSIGPACEFPSRALYMRSRVRLDGDGLSWSVIDPGIPQWATCYDEAKHTAWICAPHNCVPSKWDAKGQLQFIHQDGHKREILRTVPYEHCSGLPEVQSPDGDWWWRTGSGFWANAGHVVRLTSTGVREYPLKPPYVSECDRMAISPKGNVWAVLDTAGSYFRYDPKIDAFVKDEPWEDFAFTLGRLTLSYVMPHQPFDHPELYRKMDDVWAPFHTPFSNDRVTVSVNAVFRDRLLMTAGVSVMEYDSTSGRWARLTDTWHQAGFDSTGRRILTNFCVLAYDGDPCAAFEPDANDEPVFSRLLKQLDDERWKVRQEATRLMAKDIGKFRDRIICAADDPSLSLEVRTRLRSMLPNDGTFPPAPPPLFRTMYPALPPPK
jgi:hypothetical protein